MSGYDNFKKRTTLDGENSRLAKINDAKYILNLEFKNDPSYCDTMFLWVPGVNPHLDKKVDIRLFERKYSAANGYTIQFEIQIDGNQPDVGDYYFDSSRNQYWICTEIHEVNHIHYGGKLTLCNWVLKWQNEQGEILEYPCQDINSTQYNSGEAGDKTMTLGSAQHMATVRATEDTIAIRSPQRFFVSRDHSIPFRVTQNDTVSNNYGNGLCKITLTQDQLDLHTDRPDLGLCDYIKLVEDEGGSDINPDEITISIIGEDTLKYGLKQLYQVEGITGEYTWNVVTSADIQKIITGDGITLGATNLDDIGETISLQVLYNNEVKVEKEIKITGLF